MQAPPHKNNKSIVSYLILQGLRLPSFSSLINVKYIFIYKYIYIYSSFTYIITVYVNEKYKYLRNMSSNAPHLPYLTYCQPPHFGICSMLPHTSNHHIPSSDDLRILY